MPDAGTGRTSKCRWKYEALLVFVAAVSLSGCATDDLTSTDQEARTPLLPQAPAQSIGSSEVYIEDSGPFPSIGSTAYSRCPDTAKSGTANVFLSEVGRRGVLLEKDGQSVYFEVPINDLTFVAYVSTGATVSKGTFKNKIEVISEDQHWVIPANTVITILCRNGKYLNWPFPASPIKVGWTGFLTIVDVAKIEKTNLDEDAPVPPPSCDDPLTDEEETDPCDPPTGGATWGGGGSAMVEVSQGGTVAMKKMCDVTFWYSQEVSGTWRYTGEYTILWGTCTWEA